jgi:hypothetical protein
MFESTATTICQLASSTKGRTANAIWQIMEDKVEASSCAFGSAISQSKVLWKQTSITSSTSHYGNSVQVVDYHENLKLVIFATY